jgi:hypothetical protein
MPLLSFEDVTAGEDLIPGRQIPTAEAPSVETPSLLDVASSALRQNNIVSSLYDRFTNEPSLPDAQRGYDPFNDIAGYEDHADRFIRSTSQAQTRAIKQRIQNEQSDRDVIRRAGGFGLAVSIAAGAIDPLTLATMAIPVAPELAGASRLARIGAGVGANVALNTGSELALHQNQELRTINDSIFNVGVGALLTGVLGTIATRVPKNELAVARITALSKMNAPETSTAGAMRVGAGTTLADESLAPGAEMLAKTVGRLSPITRLMQAPVKSARLLAQELVDAPYLLVKNMKGIATPSSVETRVKQAIATRGHEIIQNLDESFVKYKNQGGAMSLKSFGREVSGAMRRGDVHDIPEVADVARKTRKLFESDKRVLQELGALPEDVETIGAKSYLPRVYDQYAISARRSELERRLAKWFTENPRKDEAGAVLDRDPAEVADSVAQTLDRLQGTVRGMTDIGGPKNPNSMRARVLDVPDEILEPFLVSDFERVLSGYNRSIVPQIEMRRTFGSTTLDKELQNVEDEFHVQQTYAKSDKVKEVLRKQQANAINDLTLMRDRVLGQTGPRGADSLQLVRAMKLARSYNYVRLLGAQTLSSLSDYGRIVAQYGLVRTARVTAKFLTNIAANKLTREDAKRMGTALEWTMDTRGATLGDIGDELAGSRIEDIAHKGTQLFTRVTLMATWNSSLKAMASALEQEAIIRAVRKGNLSALEKGKLAAHGIGDAELARIRVQVQAFGSSEAGMMRARTELWGDREAASILEQAVLRSADIVVLTRGHGDLPVFMDKELAKTLLQFKSFGMASVNRLMIPIAQGLAHGDIAAANGMAMMLALGAMTYWAKEYAAGRVADLSPERIIPEALNWSGALGFLPDLYDPLLGAPFHLPRFSRFQDRHPLESAMGPTAGTVSSILYETIYGLTDGGISQKDVHSLRKLVPLQNVFYLRRLVNALEGEAGEAVGAEGADTADFADRIIRTQEAPK